MTTTLTNFSRSFHAACTLTTLKLRTSITGFARGFVADLSALTLVRWDLNRIGSHPLGNNGEFHGLTPIRNTSNLSWHDILVSFSYPSPLTSLLR